MLGMITGATTPRKRKRGYVPMSDQLPCYDNLNRSAQLALLIYMRGLERVIRETGTKKSKLYTMISLDIPFTDSVIGYLKK
jgi:hypothetical protein